MSSETEILESSEDVKEAYQSIDKTADAKSDRRKGQMETMTTAPADQAPRSGKIPVILTGMALESLRDSGYSLAAALGEPTDNSLEAGANRIHVRLDEGTNKFGKNCVHRIVISDDGGGMDAELLHQYLQIGFSTRYMSTSTMGKYGVGAKLAALNFGRRIDVWSRSDASNPWLHVFFDLDDALEAEKRGDRVGLDAPLGEPIPPDIASIASEKTGTVLVWSKVDRLEEGRAAPNFNDLRVEVEKELARIFRSFIHGGIKLYVNGTELLPHDPLFLMTGSWADSVLAKEYRSATKDPKEKTKVPDHFEAAMVCDEPIKIGGSTARVRVTFYPKEVVRKRGMGGDNLAKLLRVPENEGAISFMRLDREISYTNVPKIFPDSVTEGDRFIGIEVSFKPELDAYFGVRNVKRGVEPHGELRKQIRDLLRKHIPQARKLREELWGKIAKEDRDQFGEHSAVAEAAAEVNRTLPKSRVAEPKTGAEAEREYEDLAEDVGLTDKDGEEKRKYIEKVKRQPFVIESVSYPGTTFFDVQHVNGQVIIKLNTRHRFYREMWAPIKDIAEREPGNVSGAEAVKTARRTAEALTLMIIAYGKAESMDENPMERYQELKPYWGQFLDNLLGKVKDVL
jgi:hypothetical protein